MSAEMKMGRSEGTSTTPSLTVQSCELPTDQIDIKNEKVKSVVGDPDDKPETQNLSGKISDSDCAAVEECRDGVGAVDVPEAARLLEMELRKRALESELKRKTQIPVERHVEEEGITAKENASTKAELSMQEHRKLGVTTSLAFKVLCLLGNLKPSAWWNNAPHRDIPGFSSC